MVYCESKGCPADADCCCNNSSEFCWMAVLCRCKAFFRKAGHTVSRWGQADQNQRGILPVGAVDTKYPKANGCCNNVPTSSKTSPLYKKFKKKMFK